MAIYIAHTSQQHTIAYEEIASYATILEDNATTNSIVFTDPHHTDFAQLGCVIKVGIVGDSEEYIQTHTPSLVGCRYREDGMEFKRTYPSIKRFKIVDHIHTDADIRDDGIELHHHTQYGRYRIIAYQSIDLYSSVEFDKPVRSMHKIGMMPAFLTQAMLTICLNHSDTTRPPTIYDPYSGTGTTLFLANAHGYDSMGTDKNITPTKQNRQRRYTTPYAQQEKKITVRKHDVTAPYAAPHLQHVTSIVTEGYLGAIHRGGWSQKKSYEQQQAVIALYNQRLAHVASFRETLPTLCFTLPLFPGNYDCHDVLDTCARLGRESRYIATYSKPKHRIKRDIILAIPA